MEAGIVAGTLVLLYGQQPHQRKTCLNDTLLHLTAAKLGMPVLTANKIDFDVLQQATGRGQFIFY